MRWKFLYAEPNIPLKKIVAEPMILFYEKNASSVPEKW